ncbi:MAG: hypothetical protein LW698_13105 [Planctomycetaceae bacterium]|jgi:hypothetical protein|nr:hypothetical protein [Planctomycetaceae bacterium]
MNGFHAFLAVVFGTPPDDVPPCVAQANSFREVVSLQALFVTLTVGLLAYVRSSPTFDLRVDLLFAALASLPLMGLYHIVTSRVRTETGDVYVCTKPIRNFARQAMNLDVAIVIAVSLLYWGRQLPGQ